MDRELQLFLLKAKSRLEIQAEVGDRIFSFVYSRLRRQKDWKLHFADSLDFDDGEGLPLSERLSDMRSDEAREQAENYDVLTSTYSEAFAYVVALSNFRSEYALLANHLAIALPTLRARMCKLNELARRQPSLFDGRQRMNENFVPLPGRLLRQLPQKSAMNFEHAHLF